MAEDNSGYLENWRDHMEDYILVPHDHTSLSGTHFTTYLIINVRRKMPYGIEDAKINQKLVTEMMEAGIKVVSFKESHWMLDKHRFPSREFFEKYWQANFGADEAML
jgi:hypothetical protein